VQQPKGATVDVEMTRERRRAVRRIDANAELLVCKRYPHVSDGLDCRRVSHQRQSVSREPSVKLVSQFRNRARPVRRRFISFVDEGYERRMDACLVPWQIVLHNRYAPFFTSVSHDLGYIEHEEHIPITRGLRQ
jgi:hypothetical protein